MGLKTLRQPTSRLAMDSATSWAAAPGGTGTVTTGTLEIGGETITALRCTGTSGGNVRFRYSPGSAFDFFSDNGTLEFYVYVASPLVNATAIGGNVLVSNDTAFSNYWTAQTMFIPGQVHQVRLSRKDFSVTAGTPSWDSENNRFQVSFTAVTGQVLDVYIWGLKSGGYARPQCVIMFDDGYLNNLETAKPIMDDFGFKGTIACVEDFVGDSGFLTVANYNTLHDDAWGIVNHSYLHGAGGGSPWLTTASVAACQEQIEHCRDYMIAQGWTRDDEHLIYCSPYGEFTENYLTAAKNAGCTFFRGTMATNNAQLTYPNMGDEWLEAVGDVLRPWPCFAGANTWTVQNYIDHINRNLAAGRHTILLFHSIVTTASAAIEWSTANFTDLMEYLFKLKPMMDFPTLPQFVKGLQANAPATRISA